MPAFSHAPMRATRHQFLGADALPRLLRVLGISRRNA
jgi:hypothetical protein